MWLKSSFGHSMSAIGLKSFIFQGSKQEIMEVVSLCKNGGENREIDVPIHPNSLSIMAGPTG